MKAHHIYETYKSTVMPHERHIYVKASDMAKAKMCTYTQSYHALPHWKCVLRCFADFPCINFPDQETDKKHEETTPLIRFHIYHVIAHCNCHGRNPLKSKKICYMFKQESSSDELKTYTTEKSS